MYSKYWQILLFEWRKQGRDGLTIPFLVGSQRYFPGTEAFQDIAALITDITTSKDFEVYIGYCMDIKQLILGVRSGNKLKIAEITCYWKTVNNRGYSLQNSLITLEKNWTVSLPH